ncbi:hypothetical protein [Escherichia coli]|uniref:hypothetical protein n=1 Tax=Escherichia coli TaxID=562 RepID=UPI003B7F46A1
MTPEIIRTDDNRWIVVLNKQMISDHIEFDTLFDLISVMCAGTFSYYPYPEFKSDLISFYDEMNYQSEYAIVMDSQEISMHKVADRGKRK